MSGDYDDVDVQKILDCLERIAIEMKKQNELKAVENEMRKFWIDKEVRKIEYLS